MATLLATLLLLAGCRGVPTPDERVARTQLAAATAEYRPGGLRPALPTLTTHSTLSDLLGFAMLNQPKVEAAYYEWAASVERITTARSLPDPQVTFQADIEDILTSLMPGLVMSFPGSGKLRAGGAIASAESEARYAAFQAATLENAFELKRTFYQLHFLDERRRVSSAMLALLRDLEALAQTQNEVGKVTLQDILRAQIERDRLQTEIANLHDSRRALFARYKASLGLAAAQPDPPVPLRFEPTQLDLAPERLWAVALAHSQRLRALAAEVRAAEAAIVLAQRSTSPDASLGLMADLKMNPVLYRPTGSISLPIWRDKIAAQIAEAQANKKASEARWNAAEIALAVDLAERSVAYGEASRNLDLFTNRLLPRARQSFELGRAAYLAGQTDFFNLIDAERTLLSLELDAVAAATQRELVLTELSLLVQGMPITASEPMSWAPPAAPQGRRPASSGGTGGMGSMR